MQPEGSVCSSLLGKKKALTGKNCMYKTQKFKHQVISQIPVLQAHIQKSTVKKHTSKPRTTFPISYFYVVCLVNLKA